MNKGVIIGIVVAVLVVAGGVFALTNKDDNKDDTGSTPTTSNTSTDSQSSTPSNENSSNSTSNTDQNAAATITYTSSGFSPATLTVKSGTVVTVKNNSSDPLQFSSDPHPQHTDNTELNMSVLAAGKSGTFTVTKMGTWGYHDHLNSSMTGTIDVQ